MADPTSLTTALSTITMTDPRAPRFILFSVLPTELRLQIWRLSCIPRVVTVTWDTSTRQYRVISTTTPAIFATSSESRSEALRIYSCFFLPEPMTPVYFAPDLDTLYIARNAYLGYSHPARGVEVNLKSAPDVVRSLAVDHVNPTERKEWETYSKWCLFKSFPHLEEAYLVLGGSERPAGSKLEMERLGRKQSVELVQPSGSKESLDKEMEDFVQSWIYDLEVGASSWGERVELDEDTMRNKFLSTILKAGRGEKWKQLFKCRDARVTSYGSESEWWCADRVSDLEWVDVPDGALYQSRDGVWYYRKGSHAAASEYGARRGSQDNV